MGDSWYSKFAKAAGQASDYARENPCTTGLCVVSGAAIVSMIAPMAVAGAGLSAVGFTANGVAAASAAAGWQASIGSVVAPSLFATLQSAAAGGYGVAAVSSAVSMASGVTAASTGIAAFWRTWQKSHGDGAGDDTGNGSEASNKADTGAKKAEDEEESEDEEDNLATL